MLINLNKKLTIFRSLSNLVNIIKSLKCSNVSSTNSLDHNVSLQKTISPLLTQVIKVGYKSFSRN